MIFAADVHLEAQSNGEKEVSADMNLCQSASLYIFIHHNW